MKIDARQLGLLLSSSVLVLGLGGCGGGGGGISGTPAPPPAPSPTPTPTPTPTPSPTPTPPPPPPPPASIYDTAEYRASNAAVAAGAITAYNDGATGRNVKIAVVDSGINGTLAEFAGRIDPASQDVAGRSNQLVDREGHGTAVTAVAAAARNNADILGVAFDATILSLNTSDPTGCSNNGCTHYDDDIARAIDIARDNGARVINISLGGPSISGAVTSALIRAADAGIVVVISAGNDGAQTPEGLAQLAVARAGKGQTIIAGAVDPAGNMSTFSNWAGNYAPYYLAALGVNVATINENGQRVRMEGTSFSAPVISGAAALLASAFPNLTGAQIVDILLKSATDIGAAGVDNKFGNGMLSITRAFQPIGTTSLAGSNVTLSTSNNGEISTAMGDATTQGLEGAIILDGYSRAFAMNLGRTLRQAAGERPLGRAIGSNLRTRALTAGATSVSVTVLEKLNGQPWVGLAQTGMSYEDSRQVQLLASAAVTRLGPRTRVAIGLSESGRTLQQRLSNAQSGAFLIAQDPAERNGFQAGPDQSFGLRQQIGKLGITMTAENGEVHRFEAPIREQQEAYRLTAVTLDRKFGPAMLSLGLSHLDEQKTVLGGRLSSEIFGGGSTSYFIDGVGLVDLGRGFATGLRYRIGWTDLASGGEIGEAGRLSSNAFSFDVSKYSAFLPGDQFALRVTQPLRVQSGGLGVRLPVSYDYNTGAVGFESRTLNLAPSGREIDFEAAYSIRVGAGDLGANLFLRRQPGHVRAAGDDVGGVIRVAWGF